jgi:hypothetical protein
MMIKESGETRALTIAQLNELMAAMLREICLATYERRYGVPASDAIQKRVQAAHSMELKEWIPNLVAARHPEEIFTQPREAAVATHALALLKRRFGINLDATTSLEVLTEQLKVYGPRILGTNPSNGKEVPAGDAGTKGRARWARQTDLSTFRRSGARKVSTPRGLTT